MNSMDRKKELLISLSNGNVCHGIMNLNFAISHFSEDYPEAETTITIYEISSEGRYTKLCERKDGEWIDFY